ncbi:MAG TPA: hypothetical protein VN612_12315 [Acidobacteriaceae bacterium]|nr:hypothetical protein [Acidobacteriaceae bacterium]
MSGSGKIDFENLKPEDFELHLPELFASAQGKLSEDSRLQKFFTKYPTSLALVRDLETIAETARGLLEPTEEPSDDVWTNIQSKLLEENGGIGDDDDQPQDAPRPNGGLPKQ